MNKTPAVYWSDVYFENDDLLCGLGGGTAGNEDAEDRNKRRICRTVNCINHWPMAMKSHSANFPHINHFTEDIKGFDVRRFQEWTPGAFKMMLAGVECTNHSIAKGGLPRDGDSRTMANDLFPYVKLRDYDYIQIENVKEFELWGPIIPKVCFTNFKTGKSKTAPKETMIAFSEINENDNWKLYENDGKNYFCPLVKIMEKQGKKKIQTGVGPWMIPHPVRKGEDYRIWRKKMEKFGYWSERRILNAADYGARTIRKRLFLIFAKCGLPIEWPKQTHNKKGTGGLRKWLPVKPVLDLEDEGYSIFGREENENIPKKNRRKYGEPTLERVYNGVLRHAVQQSEEEFINKAYGNQMNGKKSSGKSVNEPADAVTTHGRQDLVTIIKEDHFLMKWIGDREEDIKKHSHRSLKDPAPTVVCQNRLGLVSLSQEAEEKNQGELFDKDFIMAYHGNGENTKSLDEPAFAIPAADIMAKITTKTFLDIHFSNGKQSQSIDEPVGGILPNPKQKVVTVKEAFITKVYSANNNTKVNKGSSVKEPAPTVTSQSGRTSLVQGFIVDANYKGHSKGLDEPAATVLACRKHHYIVNPQYSSNGSNINDPCFTIIARMDKKPPYLVCAETGEVNIVIYEDDSPMTKKLKLLMATYGIVDIKMRMLKVKELMRIQDCRANTKIFGNQTEQKKQIGNMIIRILEKKITEALHTGLIKHLSNIKDAT